MRILAAFALAVTLISCSTSKLEIRKVGTIHTDASDGTTSGRVAIGMGQLSLGNVGLALETFRRAARLDPSSADALAGMAECYRRMGRPSLARRSIEQALALRPEAPGLYESLAGLAEAEGNRDEAASLRREAALRAAGITPLADDVAGAVRDREPEPADSVTLDLTLKPLRDRGPHLVRLSLGEVALVTRKGTLFAGGEQAVSPKAETDRTVHSPLRILNAARIAGIAARTRATLAAKGVGPAEIGDAESVRAQSELLFPPRERARAEAIAARLPFRVELVAQQGPLVLLVGRDATS